MPPTSPRTAVHVQPAGKRVSSQQFRTGFLGHVAASSSPPGAVGISGTHRHINPTVSRRVRGREIRRDFLRAGAWRISPPCPQINPTVRSLCAWPKLQHPAGSSKTFPSSLQTTYPAARVRTGEIADVFSAVTQRRRVRPGSGCRTRVSPVQPTTTHGIHGTPATAWWV